MSRSLQNRRDLLAETKLFGSASADLLSNLAARASMVTLAPNESLFMKGDPGDRLYVVVSGLIRIGAMSPEGKEVSYGVLGPGEVLGEIAVLDGRHRSADAKAIEPSQLLALERSDVLSFLSSHPDQALHLLKLLCDRIRRADELLDDIVFLSLPSRLAKHLLTLEQIVGTPVEKKAAPEIRLSQQVLGEHLGISRESVNKVLSKWEEAGIVGLGRGRITLVRVDSLREIASAG
ncbi:MAG TPA: Crp/Fnr family transcriptional regulator [Magnetospirillaceae bacterium]|nr:Crp/Fnr family transcriptional regulator [Magnetospirillaceae bacterium]